MSYPKQPGLPGTENDPALAYPLGQNPHVEYLAGGGQTHFDRVQQQLLQRACWCVICRAQLARTGGHLGSIRTPKGMRRPRTLR